MASEWPSLTHFMPVSSDLLGLTGLFATLGGSGGFAGEIEFAVYTVVGIAQGDCQVNDGQANSTPIWCGQNVCDDSPLEYFTFSYPYLDRWWIKTIDKGSVNLRNC